MDSSSSIVRRKKLDRIEVEFRIAAVNKKIRAFAGRRDPLSRQLVPAWEKQRRALRTAKTELAFGAPIDWKAIDRCCAPINLSSVSASRRGSYEKATL